MLEPKPDETDEEYRSRLRRHKLLRILVPAAIGLVLFGVLLVYVMLTHVEPAKVGARCDNKTECEPGAWCLLDGAGPAGTCVKSCSNQGSDCPAGTSCQMLDVVDKDGDGTGARTFACQPNR